MTHEVLHKSYRKKPHFENTFRSVWIGTYVGVWVKDDFDDNRNKTSKVVDDRTKNVTHDSCFSSLKDICYE